ncbi:MAG: metallophosphoesterase [Clostridia bacterium]|nr:metallophosphoesterase [Clostridia bacterium]
MRFLLMGDIHCYGHYVYDAIKKVGAPLDAIVSTGDLTNSGGQIEMESVAGAVKSGLDAIGCPDTPYIACMGNHDYGNQPHSDEENAFYRARFESVVGVPYRHVANIKGYTFITFSARNHSAGYTNEDYDWLNQQIILAEKQSEDLPIFIVRHYSSGGASLYGDDDVVRTQMHALLELHPRVVLLSGHSHAFLANERSFMQSERGFHSVNAGSLWQATKWDSIPGNVSGYYIPVVIIAECEGGKVTLRRFDIAKEEYIGKPWVIAPDCDNTLDSRAKSVPAPKISGGKVLAEHIGATSVVISYPQADEGQIEYYEAEAISEKGEAFTAKYTSHYYMPREDRGAMEMTGLYPDTAYTVTVYPVDFYGRVGEGVKGEFKTLPENAPFDNVIFDGDIVADTWMGDTQNIRDEVGFATDSDDATPYIISKDTYNFENGFGVFATNSRNHHNNSDTDFSCLQVGRYTAATCRTKEGNRVAILDGWQIDDGNPFQSANIVAEADLPYAIGQQVIGLTLFDGKLTMWRDNLPALTVDADGESEPIKIALRLGETWGVFKNCATFSKIKIVK